MTINSVPISWYSKLQNIIAVSTAESEYYEIYECARQCLWYKNLFKELNININNITINSENKTYL